MILESTDILNDENIKTQIALLQRDKIEKKNEIAILNSELEKLQNADILKKQKEKIFAKYKHLKKLDSNIVQDLIEKITVADTGENRISIDWKF